MPRTGQEQPTARRRLKSRIPHFESVEQEARFWETHSTTEFEEEFEQVGDVRFVVTRGEPKKAITVRLPEATVAAVTREARTMGIGPSTLMRMWILEHLRSSRDRRS